MELWKKIETTGCEMEDGSDTRKSKETFYLVKEEDLEQFGEMVANDCSYQDYSYSVDYKKVLSAEYDGLMQIKELIEKYEKEKAKEDLVDALSTIDYENPN